MTQTFEEWTLTETTRLHAEADTIQRALDKYMETRPAFPSFPFFKHRTLAEVLKAGRHNSPPPAPPRGTAA